MPFPWKKVTSTRISQLVNDHLHHSQKRRDGSSLVVETGFPTSLVDLFMKNREKLKQKSKKKRQNTPPVTPLCDVGKNDTVIVESQHSFPSPLPSLSPPIVESPLPCTVENEIHDSGSSDGGMVRDKRGRTVNANGVLLVILKMFLVVILALGTDRLTIGITISAFSLFFLEYAGKHLCRLLKPCSETKVVLMLQSVWRLLRFKEDELDGQNCGALSPEMKKDEPLRADCSSILENHHEEPKIYLLTRVEEIQSENDMIGCSNFIQSLEIEETELKRVMIKKEESFPEVGESKKPKKAKFKSKIKKLVKKNLRRSKKEQGTERLENISVDNLPLCEEQWEIESSSGLSSNSSGRYEKEDCLSAVSAFPALSEVEKSASNREIAIRETKTGQNWIYLVLCLIVLIGLIWGRVFALILTLSWCLLLKIRTNGPSRCLRIGSFDLYSC